MSALSWPKWLWTGDDRAMFQHSWGPIFLFDCGNLGRSSASLPRSNWLCLLGCWNPDWVTMGPNHLKFWLAHWLTTYQTKMGNLWSPFILDIPVPLLLIISRITLGIWKKVVEPLEPEKNGQRNSQFCWLKSPWLVVKQCEIPLPLPVKSSFFFRVFQRFSR